MEVEIEALRFEHDRRVVLDIPSLVLRGGRTTAILGPNGAGKTTLLRLIAALERPRAGRMLVGGLPIPRDMLARRKPAYVFQEDVFLRQSVRDNLELGLRVRDVSTRERAERIGEAARLLGITHLLDLRADRLSGGEGRRASLARALCLRAPLLLLDEPLAGLDPPTYARLLNELPRVLTAFGATTVLVTHDRDEAIRLGDDLVVLVDGRVRAAGSRRDVMLAPAGPDVAAILGFTVLDVDGRRAAIRPGALKLGAGPLPFWLDVDGIVDLVDHIEVTGQVGGVRVHVTAGPGAKLPQRGDRVLVHADSAVDVSQRTPGCRDHALAISTPQKAQSG